MFVPRAQRGPSSKQELAFAHALRDLFLCWTRVNSRAFKEYVLVSVQISVSRDFFLLNSRARKGFHHPCACFCAMLGLVTYA